MTSREAKAVEILNRLDSALAISMRSLNSDTCLAAAKELIENPRAAIAEVWEMGDAELDIFASLAATAFARIGLRKIQQEEME